VRESLLAWPRFFASALERLFADHGAPVAFHRGIVRRDKLSRDHSLDFVFRSDSNERRHRRAVLTVAGFLLRVSNPKCTKRLIGEGVVPIIQLRPADVS
jgi:hypothetical protein